jgi:hypothetical protein
VTYAKPNANLLLVLLITLCSTGCVVFNRSAKLQASVRDAETNAPIPGANVHIATMLMAVEAFPGPNTAVTDDSGVAVLKAAISRPQTWTIRAAGYLPEPTYKKVENPGPLEFRLYKRPAPHVSSIVPNGFHGPLEVQLQRMPGGQNKVGEREFFFIASATGFVRIDATPLLANLGFNIHTIDAEFEDGTKIPQEDYKLRPPVVGLRFMDIVGNKILFAVGTEQDAQALLPIINHYKNGDPHSTSTNFEAFETLFFRGFKVVCKAREVKFVLGRGLAT